MQLSGQDRQALFSLVPQQIAPKTHCFTYTLCISMLSLVQPSGVCVMIFSIGSIPERKWP
jgi:hypothetical protein